MKCLHPNCNYRQDTAQGLCDYHQREVDGKSKWSCSWCNAHKELHTHEAVTTSNGQIRCVKCGIDESDVEERVQI